MKKENNRDREIKKLVSDMSSMFIRNPTKNNMTWREIGKTLYNKGWRKTFAERKEYKVTEDDIETAFLMLSNFADEMIEEINKEKNFVDKVDTALKHLQIYRLYNQFNEDNANGEYEDIWNRFKE